jgi:hypothetical protein
MITRLRGLQLLSGLLVKKCRSRGLGSNGTEKAVKEQPLVAELFGLGALFRRDDSSVA